MRGYRLQVFGVSSVLLTKTYHLTPNTQTGQHDQA